MKPDPEPQLDPLRARVVELLNQRGSDMRKASLAIGRNPAYMHQFLYKKTPRVLGEDDRLALAEHLGIDEDELQDGRRARRTTRKIPIKSGFSLVPEINTRTSVRLSDWLSQNPAEVSEFWAFPDAVLRHEFRAKAADLRILTIEGDSMEPELRSGDRVMFDISRRTPSPPGWFVIWESSGVSVRRVEEVFADSPSVLRISSLNTAYSSYERPASETTLVGRVVWSARRL